MTGERSSNLSRLLRRKVRAAGGLDASGTSYRAFISYSHHGDRELAAALQAALHRFAKPWYRLRAIRVFRDDASLSANPNLWTSIADALARSDFFVLLASPKAAESPWVAEELTYWRENKDPAKFLIVLTDGELAWDSRAQDFDWSRTTALPASARGSLKEEPRFVDLRWAREDPDLSLANPRFRGSVADIAATLHERAKDELIGEDVRQHRRTMRIARAGAASLAALALVAGIAAWLAIGQRNSAREQRDLAEQRARIANARAIAAQATANIGTRLDRALLLAVEAVNTDPTAETRSALLSALQSNMPLSRYLATDSRGFTAVAFSADGKTLAAARRDNTIVLYDVRTGGLRKVIPVADASATVVELAFRTPRELAFRTPRELAILQMDGRIVLLDVQSGRRRALRHATGRRPPLASAISADGTRAVSYDADTRRATIWTIGTGRRYGNVILPRDCGDVALGPEASWTAGRCGQWMTVWNTYDGELSFRSRNRSRTGGTSFTFSRSTPPRLAAAGDNGTIEAWAYLGIDLTPALLAEQRQTVDGLAFGRDGLTLASTSWRTDKNSSGTVAENGTIVLWDLHTPPLPQSIGAPDAVLPPGVPMPPPDSQSDGAVSPDGKARVVLTAYGRPALVRSGEHTRMQLGAGAGRTTAMLFSPDSATLATGNEDGTVVLWDARSGRRFPAGSHEVVVISLAFSADGSMLASGSADGTIMLWDVADHRPIGGPMSDAEEQVAGLAFNRSGSRLYSSLYDGTVFVWDTDLASWKRRACARANRNLTPFEWERFIGSSRPYAPACPRRARASTAG